MAVDSSVRELLERELPRLYAFAFAMCGAREPARTQLAVMLAELEGEELQRIAAHADPSTQMLRALARYFEAHPQAKSEYSFAALDELLRTDITRPIDLTAVGVTDDPHQVHLLCWELKRTCLTAVLACLPQGVRLSFLLTDLMGLSPDAAAELIGIKPSAYRVRLTRARKRVEDYLAPRCVHVDRANPCTCEGRLMIALDADFVRVPEHADEIPHEPHEADGPHRDVGNLYRSLPRAQLSVRERDALLETLA